MVLTGSRYDRFTWPQFFFFARDMKYASAVKNKIDFIGFFVTVNPLVLPRFEAIQIAEVFRRIEQRHFLHLFNGKMDEVADLPNFHIRVRLL